ncbi:MAG TPA: ABC transporter substrate-binding protein [candidate division Zixibacteria bacterium]|nr:ABC transporter substrate-binding protein [candidate division Zixibacteria bacterium]
MILHRLIISLSIIFLLAGCGGVKEDKPLVFAVGGAPSEINFWEALIDEFSTEYQIDVSIVRQPTDTDQRRQGLVVSLKARDDDPDVFLMDVAWLAQIAASGWLAPLNTELDSIETEAFFENILDLADRYDGQLMAMPVYVDGGVLYYRNDLLENIGISRPPQTWKELIEFSLRVQAVERENNPDFYGFVWQGAQYEGLICNFLEFAVSNEGGFIFEGDSLRLNIPENVEALQLMHDIIHEYKISPPNTYTEFKEEEVRLFFQNGNALFERNWPYAWTLHQSSGSPVADKIGIDVLPHFEGGESISTLGGWHIGISAYSDMKEEARRFVEYVSSYETQKKLALNLGWNPGRRDVYDDQEVLEKLPHFADLKTVFENAHPRPTRPYYSQMSSILQKHLNSAVAGEVSPENALQSAQAEIQDIIGRYR